MAVVGTATRGLIIYQLEGGPQEFKRLESPLKYQHRCVAIFRDKKNQPTGMYSSPLILCVFTFQFVWVLFSNNHLI